MTTPKQAHDIELLRYQRIESDEVYHAFYEFFVLPGEVDISTNASGIPVEYLVSDPLTINHGDQILERWKVTQADLGNMALSIIPGARLRAHVSARGRELTDPGLLIMSGIRAATTQKPVEVFLEAFRSPEFKKETIKIDRVLDFTSGDLFADVVSSESGTQMMQNFADMLAAHEKLRIINRTSEPEVFQAEVKRMSNSFAAFTHSFDAVNEQLRDRNPFDSLPFVEGIFTLMLADAHDPTNEELFEQLTSPSEIKPTSFDNLRLVFKDHNPWDKYYKVGRKGALWR